MTREVFSPYESLAMQWFVGIDAATAVLQYGTGIGIMILIGSGVFPHSARAALSAAAGRIAPAAGIG